MKQIAKDSIICGHCKWVKGNQGAWTCENTNSSMCGSSVKYASEGCDCFEKYFHGKSLSTEIDSTIQVEPSTDNIKSAVIADESLTVTEETEEFRKDFVVGSKQIDYNYEDGKNIISVIINAISVRINVPRGTVKTFMVCLLAVLATTILIVCSNIDSSNQGSSRETTAENEEAVSTSNEEIISNRDIAISEHYSYTLPAGSIKEDSNLGAAYANAQAYSFVDDNDKFYVIRSYIMDNYEGDLEDTIRARIERVVDIDNIRFEQQNFGIGEVLLCSFDSVDGDDNTVNALQYSWRDEDSAICTVEVSSGFGSHSAGPDALKKTAESIMNTVRKTDNGFSNEDKITPAGRIKISTHYYYKMPIETTAVWTPDEIYAENEQYCAFTYDGKEYTVGSYVLDYIQADLGDVIKRSLSQYDGITYIDEQYVEGKYGDVLRIKFEAKEDDGTPARVTGYYWYESEPKICCIEVISDEWGDGKTAEMILNSVYRSSAASANSNNVPDNAQEIWNEQQKQDALDSMAEDAWREYNEPEPDPYEGRVLKP